MPEKTRSPTEFALVGHAESAIVNAASYHRRDYDLTAIRFNPIDSQHVQQSLLQPFPEPPVASLGRLDLLPLEILHEICLVLDLRSLFHLRQINKRSQHIVGALRYYRFTIEYGLDAFRAFLQTGAARYTSTSDFFTTICLKECSVCGAFGGFVFLLSCTRCCIECLKMAPQLRTSTLASAAKRRGITPKLLRKTTRCLQSVPGIYSLQELSRKRRIELVVDLQAPVPAHNERNGPGGTQGTIETFMAAVVLPYYDSRSKLIERGVCCKGCQLAIEMNLVPSRGDGLSYKSRDRVYSSEGFLRHFQWCAQAQEIYLSIVEGHSIAAKSGWIRRGGHFNLRDVVLSYPK